MDWLLTNRNGDSWTAGISDNDGLWTSMFGVGELMRYSWMKYMSYDAASLAEARESALHLSQSSSNDFKRTFSRHCD